MYCSKFATDLNVNPMLLVDIYSPKLALRSPFPNPKTSISIDARVCPGIKKCYLVNLVIHAL